MRWIRGLWTYMDWPEQEPLQIFFFFWFSSDFPTNEHVFPINATGVGLIIFYLLFLSTKDKGYWADVLKGRVAYSSFNSWLTMCKFIQLIRNKSQS